MIRSATSFYRLAPVPALFTLRPRWYGNVRHFALPRMFSDDSQPPPDRKLMMQFNCNKCSHRNNKIISHQAYTQGTVIIVCDGCKSKHLIADHKGWFREKTTDPNFDLERALKERGECITSLALEIKAKTST
eukprot:Partr_v1_DN25372_c0_g1_i2_m21813 putative zinc finger